MWKTYFHILLIQVKGVTKVELLSIGFDSNLQKVKEVFDKKSILLKEELYIDKKTKKIGNTIFLKYELKDEKNKYVNTKNILKYYIADIITDIVIDLYQDKLLKRIINDRCYYLENCEKKEIFEKTKRRIKNDKLTINKIKVKANEKSKVLKEVLDYLESNDEIILEGFISFRLRFLVNYLEDTLDNVLDDFVIEREYKEFIKILRYFVEIQEPKINTVNVIIYEDNKYELYDIKKRLINNEFLEEIAKEMSENNMNYEDLLISSLITIAPENIVLHLYNKKKSEKIVEIIKNVFENKVKICNGCTFCLSVKENMKNKR
ncbi:MAG: putative sporulation protein YtxC [Firmicutes bacterium]|nr:putative sporulation protein YtxC [Bacillota bacterium]